MTPLDRFLARVGVHNAALARAIGVDRSTVSRWRSGVKTPSGEHLARLVAWATETARSKRVPVAERLTLEQAASGRSEAA